VQTEIQKLLRSNEFNVATSILDEKDIRWKIEKSPVTGIEYLHLDYGIKASKSDVMTKECRGIALEMPSWDIVRYAFYRFMNIGEGGCDIAFDDKQDEFEYEEKSDGSIIILSYFDGRWVAGSRGVIFPTDKLECGSTLEELFWNFVQIGHENLDRNICYMFELCTMANRVVIPYKEARVVLIGARKKDEDWMEMTSEQLNFLQKKRIDPSGTNTRMRRPGIFSFPSIMDCVKSAEDLPGFQEGFVVKRWNENSGRYDRAKVKGRAYLDLHRVISSLSLRNLVRMVIFGDRESLESFPEYLQTYDTVKERIDNFCKDTMECFQLVQQKVLDIEDPKEKKKSFAMELQKNNDFKNIQGICFALYSGKTKSPIDMLRDRCDSGKLKNLIQNLDLKRIAGEKWMDSEELEDV